VSIQLKHTPVKVAANQLKLFFDEAKTRPRVNGLCQFRKGDRFYDYGKLNGRSQPTMLVIVADKKYRGPLSQVLYVRAGESEEQSIEALTATQYVDTNQWVQIG
jgi:hypothetical protein